MTIDVDIFRQRLPAFANTTRWPNELVDVKIAEAGRSVSSRFFGTRYDDALVYMTGHLLTLDGGASAVGGAATAGPVSSVTAGSVTVSYGSSGGSGAGGSSPLDATAYGREYRRIVKSIGGARLASWPE